MLFVQGFLNSLEDSCAQHLLELGIQDQYFEHQAWTGHQDATCQDGLLGLQGAPL